MIKTFMTTLLITSIANADCKMVDEATQVSEKVEDVNTSVPKQLKNATIIVKLAEGKEYSFPANEFKVVKRQQQFKLVEKSTLQTKLCVEKQKIDEDLNLVAIGARKDHVAVDAEVKNTSSGLEATVSSEKNIVLDAQYIRRKVLDTPIGAGLGLDTNGTLKAIISTDF